MQSYNVDQIVTWRTFSFREGSKKLEENRWHRNSGKSNLIWHINSGAIRIFLPGEFFTWLLLLRKKSTLTFLKKRIVSIYWKIHIYILYFLLVLSFISLISLINFRLKSWNPNCYSVSRGRSPLSCATFDETILININGLQLK